MLCYVRKRRRRQSQTEAHFLGLYREVRYGIMVLYIGGLKQASGGFHRTDVNLHADLGEKRRVFVVEELREPLGLRFNQKNPEHESLHRLGRLARLPRFAHEDFS